MNTPEDPAVPGPSRAEARAEETGLAIGEAAFAVLCQKGYHGASIRDIARAARVSEALLYHYYPNKVELVTAALIQKIQEISPQILSPLSIETPRSGKLDATLQVFFESLARIFARPESGEMFRALLLSSSQLPLEQQRRVVEALHRNAWNPAAQRLHSLLPADRRREIDAYALFRVIQGAFMGYFMFQETLGWKQFVELDPLLYRETIVSILSGGLAAIRRQPRRTNANRKAAAGGRKRKRAKP
ncbi:MAG: TetR/AcrR family transcriptional regulator [Leptospirales bacterium]|nr:TetR/AcrR family transcriptional regulator [Leptospirales bacterium]